MSLLLTFKAHQWPALLPQLAPFAGAATPIVTLQNGVPFWYVREPPLRKRRSRRDASARLFPDAQVVGGVVHVSGHIVAPGVDPPERRPALHVRRTARAATALALDALVARLFATRGSRRGGRSPTSARRVWLKLVNNVGLNPVSALRGMTIRPMLARSARARERCAR